MARTKSLIRLPFSKFKINKQTIFNIVGFLLIGFALVLLLSYAKNFAPMGGGRILFKINNAMINKFGLLSIFVPFIILFFSGHFFNTKKLRFVKPNISGGIVLVFIALLGVFQSGAFGKLIFENLSMDFSLIGAIIIMAVMFVIGLVLFLDTSIDLFILFVIDIFKSAFSFVKSYFFRSSEKRSFDEGRKVEEEKRDFIEDKQAEQKHKIQVPMPVSSPNQPVSTGSGGITIKPLAQNMKTTWIYPPLSLLNDVTQKEADRGDVNRNADVIEKTLDSFGIRARVSEVNRGPAITQYALEITQGTRLSKITALGNDLALALAATTGQVRIEAPIP